MNTDTVVVDPKVVSFAGYLLLALFSAVLALISARIAASTVNKRLYKMASELSKWQVWATAFCLVLSFTTAWGWPDWLAYTAAVGIVLMLLS